MRTGQTDTAGSSRLRTAEDAENFPVALRVLPSDLQRRLRTVYDVVRVVDDLGDEPGVVAGSGTGPNAGHTPSERLERLAAFRADLDAVWSGTPRAPVLRALAPVVRETNLTPDPFHRLLDANVADQQVTHYANRDELLGYCALSAAPIGRIVLSLFAVPTTERLLRDCDDVCIGLQLVEHWADVAEDRRNGRVYLPADAMRTFGVHDSDLDAGRATPALRRLVLHETARARELLDGGARCVGGLRGWARLAVAGYVAGGRAAADGLRRSGGEVLADDGRRAARRRSDVARHLPAAFLSGGRS